ncbi:MAG: phosphomannomutase [Verrucomicrobia bacterium]|nr:phosphomannomutase [Verrucomicrobiota bacterium]
MRIRIEQFMAESGVAFGTSGARGLVTAMTDLVCYAYTTAFLHYLAAAGEQARPGGAVALAGDFRSSTGRIMDAVARAVEDAGCEVVPCGRIPSPALALFGLENRMPAIMVTGSHIPDDRNGIKFNKASGEILKQDEQGIAAQVLELDDTLFDATGTFTRPAPKARRDSSEAVDNYVARYLDFFGPDALQGLRVGVYQHSAVGRDVLVRVLAGLGAETIALGRSDTFVPVDTEAIRPEDIELARAWARQHRFDAIVSADGDSDRPLVSDERGCWLRGDVVGILCARFLEADAVCTPVSCNTAVEKCGWFKAVHRTRIGSPYVIAAMMDASRSGATRVVGYEANGGFLLNSDLERGGRTLRALPTRDALIVIVSVLRLARQQGTGVSALAASLPARFTASDRLTNFPTEKSREILARFDSGSETADHSALETAFGGLGGRVIAIDRTDGLRVTFAHDEVIHLRPSGNAPEFRCYTEAHTEERARELNGRVLEIVRALSRAS